MMSLEDCKALDAQDALAPLRELFELPKGVVYLDGNSLGALPKTTAKTVAQTVQSEWGDGLIRSWNDAGWIDLSNRVGDKIARLIGVGPNEVVCADSTSVNLYKVLYAALRLCAANSSRRVVLSELGNFPTDLYIAQSLCDQLGFELQLVSADQIDAALTERVACLMLTHVNYRSGRMYDMAAINQKARSVEALTLWDLAHSAGAVPVDLHGSETDFAVGCGYKYLNGGPGAPAFVWANLKHVDQLNQPLTGWLGHANPFSFSRDYAPAAGMQRFVCGTPPILSLTALSCGVDTLLAAESLGGMAGLRGKSLALTDLFIELLDQRCKGFGVSVITPRSQSQRGSQVSFRFDDGRIDAYAVMQAMIARGVIGDYRASDDGSPGLLRFGFAPLYNGFADVWNAVDVLRSVLTDSSWHKHTLPQLVT
jgi:kynureninase